MTPPLINTGHDGRLQTLLCFSHLRWNFVYQRPQHLMSRFAREYAVLYFEEPIFDAHHEAYLEVRDEPQGVRVLTPHLPPGVDKARADEMQRILLDTHLLSFEVGAMSLWYYTPMSLAYSRHLRADLVVYDCMDELSLFRGAPPELIERERELLERADLVFTGGYSLYEAKRELHANVHPFPSSVDAAHFAQAREQLGDPDDQAAIPHPRIGFHGVLDERLDIDLLDAVAQAHPEWQLILLGPVVKIDPASLPQRENIHYLGGKTYEELPYYLSGWDVAMMPFALNESTRYISPTKTPEYLAGGRAVVSTPVKDVVRSYGQCGLVSIADTSEEFAQAIARELQRLDQRQEICIQADTILSGASWDNTWSKMRAAMNNLKRERTSSATAGKRLPWQGSSRFMDIERSDETDSSPHYDYLIVGAGFAGSVLAERLAAGANKKVLVVDKRPHIGGNAYDYYDEAGVLVHKYGPHIFHTNSQKVLEYLSRFTAWRPYEHRVLAQVNGKLVPIPINLTTLELLYDRRFTPEEARTFLSQKAEPVETIRTSEDVVINAVGRELYEMFFRGYTRKQWGLDPSQLDKSVTSRIPTRTSLDDRYFTDTFQFMPLAGYTRMFERMLDHPNIEVHTSTSFEDVRDAVDYEQLIYCGPIDEFFEYCYGPLPYRSLEFQHVTLDTDQFQPVAVVNYPAEHVPYTRITEYKHLTGQEHSKTSISYEFPRSDGDPYYPIPRPENAALYRKYQALADARPDVHFVGRLGTYQYYNMDQVVAQALAVYERLASSERRDRSKARPALQGAAHNT